MSRAGEVVVKAGLTATVWISDCWLVVMLFPGQVMFVFANHQVCLETGEQAIRIFGLLLSSTAQSLDNSHFKQ